MNSAFFSVYTKLEQQRSTLLADVNCLSTEKFLNAPPGKWSIAQILTHLLTSEQLSVSYMKKKSLGINTLKDSGIAQSILLSVLKISQRIPFRYKAPKVIVQHTPKALSLAEIELRWDAIRTDLQHLLENIEDKNVRKLIFKHPFAGRLDAAQAVSFMYEHINHHRPQIRRLLNQR